MFFEERQIRFYLQINLKFVLIRTSKERFAVIDKNFLYHNYKLDQTFKKIWMIHQSVSKRYSISLIRDFCVQRSRP